MNEVYLDNNYKDAAASVRLTTSRNTGTFALNPYWVDAMIYLSGFVLNGDVNKSNDIAYISTGFKELFILEPLKQNTEYMSFSSIQIEDKKGISLGQVHVFQEQRLVAVCAGISFQKMNKNVLRMIMRRSEATAESKITEQPADSSASSSTVESCDNFASTPITSESNRNMSQIAQTLLAAVASETGYKTEDMEQSAPFADMGVDSLMSIAIVSAVQRKTGVELPGSFFQKYPTVAHVSNEFTTTDEISRYVSASQSPAVSNNTDDDLAQIPSMPASFGQLDSKSEAKNNETLLDQVNVDAFLEKPIQTPIDLSAFSSQAILIQGRAMSKATPLFLIADGAGSAAAYIHLPPLSSGGKIYALESPFLNDPSKFICNVEKVARLYLIALRKVQPEGPYILGGSSARAVFAYEVSRLLLNQGETVQSLILIDMRVPKPMPDGIQPTMELIEEAGLVIGLTRAWKAASTVSKVTKQHLLETVKALMVYKPIAMDTIRRPTHTCLIWAKKGLKEREGVGKEPEPETMDEDSPVFSNIMEDPATGSRHGSMLRGPASDLMAGINWLESSIFRPSMAIIFP